MISSSPNKSIEEELFVETNVLSTSITEVINRFSNIFGKPKGIPPHRHYDHQINIKEEAQTMWLRPYRYGALHKDMIEKLTQ